MSLRDVCRKDPRTLTWQILFTAVGQGSTLQLSVSLYESAVVCGARAPTTVSVPASWLWAIPHCAVPSYMLYQQARQRAQAPTDCRYAGGRAGQVQRSAGSPSASGERRLMMADYAKFANSHPLSALIGPPVGVKRPPVDDLLPAQPKRQAVHAEVLPDLSTLLSRPSRDKARDASSLQVRRQACIYEPRDLLCSGRKICSCNAPLLAGRASSKGRRKHSTCRRPLL